MTRYVLAGFLLLTGAATAQTDPPAQLEPANGRLALELRPWAGISVEPWMFWALRQDRLDPNDLADSRIDPDGTAGYAVWNLRAGWTPTARTRLQLDLRNLLDHDYREHGSGIDGAGVGVGVSGELSFGS